MNQNVVHVAAGVVVDAAGRVLIARRPVGTHQGNLWEFPGGKLEDTEDVEAALKRELYEEIGITVQASHPLIRIHYTYPDKQVLLDVWKVTAFTGIAQGKEGQPVQWVRPDELNQYDFPAANMSIITAAQLPNQYMITDEYASLDIAYSHLKQRLDSGIKLIQLRAKYLSADEYRLWAKKLMPLCREYNALLLLNNPLENVTDLNADGLHLSSSQLLSCQQRPLDKAHWVSASVHNEMELKYALAINVDFVVISPILKTQSHPQAPPLGWDEFYRLTECASCPVYALGGLSDGDLYIAFKQGAQGIAAIRGLA